MICDICKANTHAFVRIESKIYCLSCDPFPYADDSLGELFDEVREAERMPGYTVAAWNE